MKKQKYVLGFLFSEDRKHVVLIVKGAKPNMEWQDGCLNGLGGKIKADEVPIEAMRREFNEECGLDVPSWNEFAIMYGDFGRVHCFRAFSDDCFLAKTNEDEEVVVLEFREDIKFVEHEKVSNLRWLIEMALDAGFFTAQIFYPQNGSN